jgi:hypothetical protein
MASASWPGIAPDSKWKNRRQLQLLRTAPAVRRELRPTDICFLPYPVAVRYLHFSFSFADPDVGDLLFAIVEDQHHVLAVLTAGGRLSLIKGFDDVHPCSALDEDDDDEGGQRTGGYCGKDGPCWNKGPLSSPMMEWNNDGELLCLGGHHHVQSSSAAALHHYANILQFYNSRGVLRFRIAVPYTQVSVNETLFRLIVHTTEVCGYHNKATTVLTPSIDPFERLILVNDKGAIKYFPQKKFRGKIIETVKSFLNNDH